MAERAHERGRDRLTAWSNLVLPGAGLILGGDAVGGMVIGLAFAVCANIALISFWILPGEFSHRARALAVGLAFGFYLGAQIRLSLIRRVAARQASSDRRRAVLGEVQQRMVAGDHRGALAVLSPLAQQRPDDLLVNYRLAQLLTAAGTVHAARAAWKRVRSLDRHGIYREQARMAERKLSQGRPAADSSAERTSG
jgi:hypothetical protein